MNKRIVWVDIAKYICIMCVMASHLHAMPQVSERFFTPFYLTLFFFCSGYVHKHREGFGAFLWKKTRQLFIPWLLFSLMIIILSQILTFQEHADLGTELMWCFLQIRGRGDQMWFVAALFVACVPFYFVIRRYSRTGNAAALLAVSFGLSLVSLVYMKLMDPALLPWGGAELPWHLEYIFQAMFFMVLGYLFRERWESRFDRLCTLSVTLAALGVYLLLIYGLPPVPDNGTFDIVYGYASQLLAIFWVVGLCKKIPNNRYLAYIGQNTLICFGFNGKLVSLIEAVLTRFAGAFYSAAAANTVTATVLAAVLAVVMSLILIIPIWVINRWFPFMVGKPYRRAPAGLK